MHSKSRRDHPQTGHSAVHLPRGSAPACHAYDSRKKRGREPFPSLHPRPTFHTPGFTTATALKTIRTNSNISSTLLYLSPKGPSYPSSRLFPIWPCTSLICLHSLLSCPTSKPCAFRTYVIQQQEPLYSQLPLLKHCFTFCCSSKE